MIRVLLAPALSKRLNSTYSKSVSNVRPVNIQSSSLDGSKSPSTNHSHILGPLIPVTVESITNSAPNVKTITLNPNANPDFQFKPGQWIELSFPCTKASPKAQFSISSAPSPEISRPSFQITVKDAYQNPIVKYLHDSSRKPGDSLQGRIGGSFYYKPLEDIPAGDTEKILMVGGGVGIAPLMAMLEHLVNESKSRHKTTALQHPRNVTLIYSVRDEKELLFRDRLNELCRVYGGLGSNGLSIEVQCFVTRYAKPAHADDMTLKAHDATAVQPENSIKMFYGFYITPRLLSDYFEKSNSTNGDTVVYMCGPESLERAVYGYLQKLDFPLQRLHFEQWWK
ncbi:hypothetical protein BDR26DRAFT_871863 [Obelidium mucronatum]|nr:hypothetical protein BDR26DRAFT_871863 [Obelidium mucronatum]